MMIDGISMNILAIRRGIRPSEPLLYFWSTLMPRSLIALLICLAPSLAMGVELQVGVGRIDVTPTTPIRLSGYAARKTESEGVEQKIYARAIALGTNKADASVLMTLDSMAFPRELTEEVAA